MSAEETNTIRVRIMQEAARLFVERGYNGISMREIAEACELSKAGIYYHFKDKEDLYLAICIHSLEDENRCLLECQQMDAPVQEKLRTFLRTIFSSSPDRRAFVRVSSQEIALLSEAAQLKFRDQYHHLFVGQIARLLEGGMEQGEIRKMDPELLTWLFMGIIYPFFSSSDRLPRPSGEENIDLILNVFFNGVAASHAE